MGKNNSFAKNTLAVLNGKLSVEAAVANIKADHKASNILPDPPAEIQIDMDAVKTEMGAFADISNSLPTATEATGIINETTNPEKEITMETTETTTAPETTTDTKTVKPTRAQLVTVAKEMNSILADCKIPTSNSYSVEVLVNMIKGKELELTSADFALTTDDTRSADSIFSTDAIATMTAIGITIPTPPAPKVDKAAAKTTRKTSGYTRQQALVDAIKSGSGTRDEIVAKADTLYRAAHPIVISEDEIERKRQSDCDTFITTKLLRESTPILLAFGAMLYNEETKIYSLPAIETAKA